MRYVWVGFGGAFGSVMRYAIGVRVDQSHFPWATLGINLSGSFVLGLFLTVTLGHLSVAVITPVAVGVLGELHHVLDIRVGRIHACTHRARRYRLRLCRCFGGRWTPRRSRRLFPRTINPLTLARRRTLRHN